jgi:hypothetical protein
MDGCFTAVLVFVVATEFATMNFTVVLLSPLAGWIVDKTRAYFGVMAVGLSVSLISLTAASFDISMDPLVLFIVASAGCVGQLR